MGTFLKKSVHLDGDLVEPASARGECEVPLSLFAEKERGPEFGLQGLQLLAESRLRHEEVAGGLVQGTGLCDRQEHADIILIHEAGLLSNISTAEIPISDSRSLLFLSENMCMKNMAEV